MAGCCSLFRVACDQMLPFDELTQRGQISRLRRLALKSLGRWRLKGARLRLLNHGENTVFGVRLGAEPERYVLRVHRNDYHPLGDLRSELVWLDYLGSRGIGTPLPVPGPDGLAVREVYSPGVPGGRRVSLLLKTPGRIAGMGRWGRGRARQVGRLIAQLHLAAQDFEAPPGFSRRILDAEGMVGARASWGDTLAEPLLDDEQRELFGWARERLLNELAALPRDRHSWGYVHSDLHPGNVLFGDGEARAIDFDDLASSWYVGDFVLNLLPLRRKRPDLASHLLSSYRELRPLTEESLAALTPLSHARQFASIAWLRSRADVPGLLEALPERIHLVSDALADWRAGKNPQEVGR